VQAYKDAFRACREAGSVGEPLYDGIAALIADLDAAGWLLGVATGKSDRGLAHCLERHGLTDISSLCRPPTATLRNPTPRWSKPALTPPAPTARRR
jgi:phosphoglycolate phosphatase-like HAD superfamily hydrolase